MSEVPLYPPRSGGERRASHTSARQLLLSRQLSLGQNGNLASGKVYALGGLGARGSLQPRARSILAISPLFGTALPASYS